MPSAKIYFADGSSLTVHENDLIIPIVIDTICEAGTGYHEIASMASSVKLVNHPTNGVICSLMDAFCFCRFFYVNDDMDTIYGTASIVKIENL